MKTHNVYIPIKHLSVVWVQAQRPYDERWAKSIADDFDPDKFDPIVVTKPNGEGIYHIIEGQHRRHALRMFAARCNGVTSPDDEQAPCRVIDEADPARAAEIWLGINAGRKPVPPIVKFNVAVIANRPIEVAINRCIHRVGFKVSANKQKDTISAVSALRMIYNRHGIITLEQTLKVLRYLWDGDPQAVTSPMLRGFAMFMNEFGDNVAQKRLRQQVGFEYSPYAFHQAAEARKVSTREPTDEAISELIIREYNKGLKDDSRLRHKKTA
jgi:hypothetical protein